MKRAALLLVLVAVAGCKKAEPTHAAPPPPPASDPWAQTAATPTPKAKNPLPRPLFWSIEKDGKTSYALGTIHAGVDANDRLPQIVWDKLEAVPAFAMETDLGDASIVEDLQKCDKCSLKRDLGDAYWKKLEDAVGKAQAAGFEPMQPAIAVTYLSLKALPKGGGQMDTTLLGRAQNKGKRIVYLEKAELQAKLLTKWMDVKALKSMLDEPDYGAAHIKETADAYIAGDAAKLEQEFVDEKASALEHGYTEAEYAEQMKDMLYDRNASWIAPIEVMHDGGGGFIAVGAMHLVGKNSVLDMLSAKGFKVTRVAP